MVLLETVVGGSSGRSVWAHHAVYGGGFWANSKSYKKNFHGYSSNRLFICQSRAFKVSSLSNIETKKSKLDNESDDFLRISQSSLSTEGNEVETTLLEKNYPRKKSPGRSIDAALAEARKLDSQGNHSSFVQFLLGLDMEMVEIELLIRKFPSIMKHEDSFKSGVDFVMGLGPDPVNIPKILRRHPHVFSTAGEKSLRKTAKYFKKIGMDNKQLIQTICRHPSLFNCSTDNIHITVSYFREIGLSDASIVRIIAWSPLILAISLEESVIPKIRYFESIGLNVMRLIKKNPEVFGMRIDTKFKRVVEFFLERDFSMEEVQTVLNRYQTIFTLSLEKNLVPKWEYLVYMDYPKRQIIMFPGYFGFSLEKRIKPRFERMVALGKRMRLHDLLISGDKEFEIKLERQKPSVLNDE